MVRIQFSRTWKSRFAQNLVEDDHDIRLLEKSPHTGCTGRPRTNSAKGWACSGLAAYNSGVKNHGKKVFRNGVSSATYCAQTMT
jgi:hypothetical protein